MTTTYTDPTAGFHAYALQARTDDAGTPVDDAGAADLRAVLAILTAGVVTPAAGFAVAPDANLDLAVGSGTAYTDVAVVAGTDPGQGRYLVRLGDDETTVTLDAADLSNPRIDELYLVVLDDQYDSSGLVLPRLAVRKGTAAASPSAPGPDGSWKAYLKLAEVLVGAGVTSITAGNITDARAFAALETAAGGVVPVGGTIDFAGAVAPAGWLLCDGSAVSRTTYARLFAAIGVVWGPGDGSSTFNLPDLRRRFKIGSGSGLTLGQTGGAWDHVHAGPDHQHGPGTLAVPAHAAHFHTRGTLAVPDHAQHQHGIAHTHTFSDSFTTSSYSHTYFERGSGAWGFFGFSNGTHSHTGSVSGTTSAASVSVSDLAGPTSHGTITGQTSTDGPTTHGAISGLTAAAGTGNTGSANPPYAVLNALIRT